MERFVRGMWGLIEGSARAGPPPSHCFAMGPSLSRFAVEGFFLGFDWDVLKGGI
jgi:hypothetical protein